VQGEDTLPAEVQVTFYRVCQEALNNIAKHAGADRVTIDLRYEAGSTRLQIVDNGRGFDPAAVPAGHYGLSMMQERAKAIGADLVIASRPGQGAEIMIRWSEQTDE
jgi:two-component system, NarL family, sensor kinase